MEIKYNIKGLDCANCALELERSIKKIKGVNSCNINFIMETMNINVDEEIIMDDVIKCIKKEEPDCSIEKDDEDEI